MACKAISEHDGKRLLSKFITETNSSHVVDCKSLQLLAQDLASPAKIEALALANPWVHSNKLVVKPDQLLKRRGKLGLVGLKLDWAGVVQWAKDKAQRPFTVNGVTGPLDVFIVEPFVPHGAEIYLAIVNTREGEDILFYHEGGIDIGEDLDGKVSKLQVPIDLDQVSIEQISTCLLGQITTPNKLKLAGFIQTLWQVYRLLHFSYLEINPLVELPNGDWLPLDLAAKLDETAEFLCGAKWGDISFPSPFGRPLMEAERKVHELDEKTGASLKLTILNPKGRIWTMVAGGGASVVYADTVCDLGHSRELANYGEYSGDPSEEMTCEYARALLSVMCDYEHPDGKVLIIGGGIANFTNVAATFTGIIRALKEFAHRLLQLRVKIYVRRGGPNYQQGLKMMRQLGAELNLPISVHGPEENIVSIVPLALGLISEADMVPLPKELSSPDNTPAPSSANTPALSSNGGARENKKHRMDQESSELSSTQQTQTQKMQYELFAKGTKAIVFGLQERAVQGMLDFDFICGRSEPSVACLIFPFAADHLQKFYYGTQEKMIPVYKDLARAVQRHPDTSVFINFSSFRSAYATSCEALQFSDTLKTMTIIAEGIPEQLTRRLGKLATERGVTVIGPATVGALKAGTMRLGNTAGMIDNVIAAKLYRAGNVSYCSRSGGMSNELNNIIARHSNGVREGIAIGGDRYPCTRFIDHLLRFQQDPECLVMVLLGEVGGSDEYDVIQAIRDGRLTKPLVAWTIGTCASHFGFEVQFGHAGALAQGLLETANAKNEAFRQAGVVVPKSFATFGEELERVFAQCSQGLDFVEPAVPSLPMDFAWARKLGLVRKPAAFVSTISDDRGEELSYAGMPISRVIEEQMGIGGTLALLWFKRRLPAYACKFIELILVLTADHGPAVSGAHNTIVAARCGKGLVESLVSGLLCIGPRFGGALDDAAKAFTKAVDRGISPKDWIQELKNRNELIMGIGHKVKSVSNPDKRVQLVIEYCKTNFPFDTTVLDFALGVERLTTKKKANLILNVDGAVAAAFVDMLRQCGSFTREEADEAVENGTLNGLFVVGRSIGFVGHFLDQNRLKQGLYRHPVDDIAYSLPTLDY
ncbi:hypothetical protein BASA81_006685 [Batrachochytrium salamandrivorans]|nr:hypothetical protein BASA81_006685 [Batrachochytrium salamandrivorans]